MMERWVKRSRGLLLLKVLGGKNLVVLEVLMRTSAGTMKAASWLIIYWSDSFSFSCFVLRTSDAHEIGEGVDLGG